MRHVCSLCLFANNSGLQNELCRHLKSVSAKNFFFPVKTILHDDVIDIVIFI